MISRSKNKKLNVEYGFEATTEEFKEFWKSYKTKDSNISIYWNSRCNIITRELPYFIGWKYEVCTKISCIEDTNIFYNHIKYPNQDICNEINNIAKKFNKKARYY